MMIGRDGNDSKTHDNFSALIRQKRSTYVCNRLLVPGNDVQKLFFVIFFQTVTRGKGKKSFRYE